MKQYESNINDNDEASFNWSLDSQKNSTFVVNKLDPEIRNYNNNNYNQNPYNGDNIQDFEDLNFLGGNQEQTENSLSSSISSSELYFINGNNNNESIQKEEEKEKEKEEEEEEEEEEEKKEEEEEEEEKKQLNKKRAREKEGVRKKIFVIKRIEKIKFNQGRRGKLDNDKRKHNCNSEDNIINKIKTHFFHYIRDIISKNSNNENEEVKIIKFRTEFVANLKKDKNIELLETKMLDILKNQEISTKNKNSDEYENKNIIDKIYKEKKEKRVIKILELKFKELLIIFRRKLNKVEDKKELKKISKKIKGLDLIKNDGYDDTQYLIDDIKKRNSKNNRMNDTELEEYINKVLDACKNYEKWFYNKIEKKRKIH